MIGFGANPAPWSNDDDHAMGGHIPLEQRLREAAEIGFDGVEKGWKFPTEPAALRAALAPHGLAFISGWWSMRLLERGVSGEIAAMRGHLDLLKAMGCTVAILCETTGATQGEPEAPLLQRPELSDGEWPGFCERLTELAKRIAEEGDIPVCRHHMGAVVQTRTDVDRRMAGAGPELKLLLDTGPALFAGADPVALAADYAERTAHFHAKNVRPDIMARVGPERLSFLQAVRLGVYTAPGDPEGAVDFPVVMKVLAAKGYDGWLVIEAEQEPTEQDPVTFQSMGLTGLRALAREVGLTGSQTQ